MPFKSKAQQAYLNWAAEHNKVSRDVVKEFNKASKGKTAKLPEHVKKKSK